MSSLGESKIRGLGYKLKKAQHLLRISMDEALKPLNLTTPQYAVLSELELSPGISNADLARASFVTAQTMHGIVRNLEKNRLVKRKQDLNHGRIICTQLTAKGLKTVRTAHGLIANVQNEMTNSIAKKNIVALEEMLWQCIGNLAKK